MSREFPFTSYIREKFYQLHRAQTNDDFMLLTLLSQAKAKYPELRLGQLLWNLLAKENKLKAPEANSLFYIEDEELSKLLQKMIK